MLTRRSLVFYLSTTALVGILAARSQLAATADKTVTIGINLPFTGADAHDAELIKDGAMLAIDEANAAGGVGGYKIDVLQLDDGTATAGQYDPGTGRHQRAQDGVQRFGCCRDRPADERFGQSNVANFEPGRSRHDHSKFNQPRYYQSEIRRTVSAGRQTHLFSDGHDRCLSGAEHGELFRRHAEGQVGLHSR